MRIYPFKIPRTGNSSIGFQEDVVPHFYDVFHQHPEIQMTLVIESSGTLFLGDYVGDFEAGDLFIIGSNVPHVFKNDQVYFQQKKSKVARSISVFFEEHSLGKGFIDLPEASKIKSLFSKTRRGLKFGNTTYKKIFPMISQMGAASDIERIIRFIHILKVLSEEQDFEFLTHDAVNYNVEESEGKRLNDIFQFTMSEFHREITLEEVAEIANMTPTSFCRYFKKRTRKTYIDFLNEVRINHACKLLFTHDMTVSEVCELCGFNNLSNFNRHFKKIKGVTPKILKQKTMAELSM